MLFSNTSADPRRERSTLAYRHRRMRVARICAAASGSRASKEPEAQECDRCADFQQQVNSLMGRIDDLKADNRQLDEDFKCVVRANLRYEFWMRQNKIPRPSEEFLKDHWPLEMYD